MNRNNVLVFLAGVVTSAAALSVVTSASATTPRGTVLELLSFEGTVNKLPDGGTEAWMRACGHERELAADGGMGGLKSEPCWRVNLPAGDVTVERIALEGAKLLKKEE
jgi:hypothetical protein